MKKIIILQGPPAAGKSTLARQLHAEDKNKVIVSRDAIRESRGDYWLPSQENYISDIETFEVEAALNNNLIPIIDATNLNPKTISKWNELAEKHGAAIEFKECIVPYEEACKRDEKRGNKVGKEVIKKFYKKYYPDHFYTMREERKMMPFNPNKPNSIIVDIDGTLALRNNRSPFDYEKVLEDNEDFRMVELISEIMMNCDYNVIFVTGREDVGNCKALTMKWLEYRFGEDSRVTSDGTYDNWKIFMRAAGDKRPDEVVKKEIYENKIEPWYNVVAVFDDRNKVVNMWRDLGLLCLQPYPGDF